MPLSLCFLCMLIWVRVKIMPDLRVTFTELDAKRQQILICQCAFSKRFFCFFLTLHLLLGCL
uniref:Uncharacterized protein n=1 Tax=Rhizophora mucronata TaxID=61149 RepID=A0A2P2IKW6_RHIMU